MSIFSKLHNLTQHEESLVELAQNKDRALQGASEEEIHSAVERALEERDFVTREETLTESDVTSLIEAYGRDGITEEEAIALIEVHASGDGGLSQEDVIALIEEHAPESGDGLTREEIIALIEEHAPTGMTEEGVLSIVQANSPSKEDLERTRERLNKLIDDLESKISDRTIGPDTPSGDEHSNPGWGLHFSTEEPLHFGEATIQSLTSGTINVELHEYRSGDTVSLVDSTTVELPTDGVQTIDLDIDVPEPGQYLLTRDYDTQPDDFVSLWRQNNYTGWNEDSDEALTLHGSGHNEYSDNSNWYYWFNLHVFFR